MSRTVAMLLLCTLVLAACGADGPPIRPAAPDPAQTGLTITGQARVGVTASN